MKKKIKNYVVGMISILFAIWIIWQSSTISEKLVSNEPGPRLFPRIAAAGIIVCAILSMIFDKGNNEEKRSYLDKQGWKRLGLILAEIIVFALAMHYLGTLLAGSIMLFVFIMTLKDGKNVNILFATILSVGLTCIVYFGFTKGFHLILPKGELWRALGIKLPF